MMNEKGTSLGHKTSAKDRLNINEIAVCLRHNQNYAGDLLLKILTTVKDMNILNYYCNFACLRTNICTQLYSCDICTISFVHAVICC